MDRIQLIRNGIIVYDNAAEFTLPVVPIPASTPAPVSTGGGVLAVNGQPYDFGIGMTSFRMPVVGGHRYTLTTAECYKPVTVFVKRADGSEALPPVTDNGGHAYAYFQAQGTEDYVVMVQADEQAGHIQRQEA